MVPISFFKNKEVLNGDNIYQKIFTSSSTTGMVPAKHYVKDLKVYEDSFNKAFKLFYGDIKEYTILALLPSYLEREGSSLIYMSNSLINASESDFRGFYLYNY